MRVVAWVAPLLLVGVPARAQAVLDGIVARGTLRVGLTGDYRPFSSRDAAGAFSGLDVDLADGLAKSLGVKLEIVPTAWRDLVGDIGAERFDIAMGGIAVTLPRARSVLFTTTVMRSGKTPIARCLDKEKFGTVAEIDRPGVRVIFNPGGTNEVFANANFKQAQKILFADNATIFGEIVAGRADVMVTDAVETRLQQKLHPELCAIHPEAPFDNTQIAYMLPRDLVWQQYVNVWLQITADNGGRARLTERWLP